MNTTDTLAQHAPIDVSQAAPLVLVAFERVSVSPACTLLRVAGDWYGAGAPPATATLRVATPARDIVLTSLPHPARAAAGEPPTWRAAFALPAEAGAPALDRCTLVLNGCGEVALPAPIVRTTSEAASAQARARIGAHQRLAMDLRDRLARTQAELRIARREAARPARRGPAGRMALALGAGAIVVALVVVLDAGDRPRAAGSAARLATAEPAAPVARERPSRPPDATPAARAAVPAWYLELYSRAGRRYGLDWAVLAAIGQIESGHGAAELPGVAAAVNRAGAAGPAQFLFESWRRFGVDGDGDGRIDPYAPADAISAMAAYLRAHGAPDDWQAAIRAYNHDDSYVERVLRLAAGFRRD